MCKFFCVSRSEYYDYVKRMGIPARNLPLAEKIRSCQESCGQTYGYRRVHIWLEKQGVYRNPKTVLRGMQKYGLLSVIRRKKYSNYLHRYDDLLKKEKCFIKVKNGGHKTAEAVANNSLFAG